MTPSFPTRRSSDLLVPEPEEVEAGLVPRDQLLVAEPAPAPFWVALGASGRLPLVPVPRVVALDEIRQILEPHRLLFERVVHVGPVVVVPDRSEEHTSELQSLMRTSYAVFCL